jgi:hypothetical protein
VRLGSPQLRCSMSVCVAPVVAIVCRPTAQRPPPGIASMLANPLSPPSLANEFVSTDVSVCQVPWTRCSTSGSWSSLLVGSMYQPAAHSEPSAAASLRTGRSRRRRRSASSAGPTVRGLISARLLLLSCPLSRAIAKATNHSPVGLLSVNAAHDWYCRSGRAPPPERLASPPARYRGPRPAGRSAPAPAASARHGRVQAFGLDPLPTRPFRARNRTRGRLPLCRGSRCRTIARAGG